MTGFSREELQLIREERHRLGATSEPKRILLARRNAFGQLSFEEVIILDLPDPGVVRTPNRQVLARGLQTSGPAKEG